MVVFGDRRFVILIGYRPDEGGNLDRYYGLYNQKLDERIDYKIYNYKRNKPYVFMWNGASNIRSSSGEYKKMISTNAKMSLIYKRDFYYK